MTYKFRIWDKVVCKYLSDDAVLLIPFKDKNFIVEIWTGEVDINGQEIYEGDVLEYFDDYPKSESNYFQGEYWMNDGSDPFVKVKRKFYIKQIKDELLGRRYINYYEYTSPSNGERVSEPVIGLLNKTDFKDFKVIGNINENLELLRQNEN